MTGRDKNIFSNIEVEVLRYLGTDPASAKPAEVTPPGKIAMVSDISTNTGIRDNDEVLRALYTLEGKQLVQPEPEWDFTSSKWKITRYGIKAIEVLGLTP